MAKNPYFVICYRVITTVFQCMKKDKNEGYLHSMTHFQELFVRNLRFFRKKKGISQLKFSEIINVSPNYLNAVENGKNFPSPEVVQQIIDTLGVLPYQLFLEHPVETMRSPDSALIQELIRIKQQFVKDIEELIQKHEISEPANTSG